MTPNWCVVLGLLAATASAAHADDDGLYKCSERTGTITVSFKPQTPLKDLAIWVMGFTCKNVVFDSDVESRVPSVTILSPKPMTAKQALALFVDAVEATGLKVVQKKDTLIIKLGPNMPKTCPSVASTGSSSRPDVHTAPQPPDATVATDTTDSELEKLFDTGIKKISDTHIEISSAVVDAVLANPMAVAKGARVVPAIKDGKPDGFKLYAIRPSSVYARLGFTNGDTIKSVNGLELTSADKALEVYTKLREAKQLKVDLVRRGKAMTLVFTIK